MIEDKTIVEMFKTLSSEDKEHDLFFKLMMADHNVAKEFCEVHLPKKMLDKADLSQLKHVAEDGIDLDLSEERTSILYSIAS